jgi:hypothetical protein
VELNENANKQCRFLQSKSSNLIIYHKQASQEHGVAAICCLLSGVGIFTGLPGDNGTYLRVIQGVHGLHLYATEYWADYLVDEAASNKDFEATSPLFVLANKLAQKLGDHTQKLTEDDFSTISTVSHPDPRLTALNPYPILRRLVESEQQSRSLKSLEASFLSVQGTLIMSDFNELVLANIL